MPRRPSTRKSPLGNCHSAKRASAYTSENQNSIAGLPPAASRPAKKSPNQFDQKKPWEQHQGLIRRRRPTTIFVANPHNSMQKVSKKQPLPSRRRHPEAEVRQRIRGLIEAGGIYPISATGEKNLAGLFGYPITEIRDIIAEESRRIMQLAPDPYVRDRCWCSPPEQACMAYQRCVVISREGGTND